MRFIPAPSSIPGGTLRLSHSGTAGDNNTDDHVTLTLPHTASSGNFVNVVIDATGINKTVKLTRTATSWTADAGATIVGSTATSVAVDITGVTGVGALEGEYALAIGTYDLTPGYATIGITSWFAKAPYADIIGELSPAVAYSLRKVTKARTGSAIQVRRSSDNTLLDIGFDASGNLDTDALTTFVGKRVGYPLVGAGNDGFVSRWYDQSATGFDLVQTTHGQQPMIVEAGALVTQGGKPAVKFVAANNTFMQTAPWKATHGVQPALSIFEVFNGGAGSENWASPLLLEDSATGGLTIQRYAANDSLWLGHNSIDTEAIGSFVGHTVISIFVGSALDTQLWQDGVKIFDTATSGDVDADGSLIIGQHNKTTGGSMEGTVQELIIFSTDQSTNRAAIETNQQGFWGMVP